MSEVKKLIVSRKKKDQHGNEYALIKISSNQTKRPEIRVIKFKKSPKKSKSKLVNNEENTSTTKTYSSKAINKEKETITNITNMEMQKKELQSNITDSPTTRRTKFNSFISNFNTISKGKNSFIYKSPKQSIHPTNLNFLFPNNTNLSNGFHKKNVRIVRINSEAYKAESTFGNEHFQKEFLKKRENLNNKILILAKKSRDYYSKINNLKLKESKLNIIRIKKNKEKEKIRNAKSKKKYETEYKKQIINEIKEINKEKKKATKEINLKENKLKNNGIKNDKDKIKKIIKISKKEIYQKKRYNYLKIRKEEENLKNKRQRWENLSSSKKIDGHFNFAKTMIEDDFKEIGELKRKYQILKLLNKEYNDYMREIKDYGTKRNTKRTFTPLSFNRFMRKYFSYNNIEPKSRQIISSETSVERCRNKMMNINPINKNTDNSCLIDK